MTTEIQQRRHYHVLHGLQGANLPDVNYVALDIGVATDLIGRETEMDREYGRTVEQVTSREWHISDGDTAYTLEITNCSETDCYQAQPLSRPKGWMVSQ